MNRLPTHYLRKQITWHNINRQQQRGWVDKACKMSIKGQSRLCTTRNNKSDNFSKKSI